MAPEIRVPTEVLVQRAKRGDRDSLNRLLERYYDTWLRRHHRKLGKPVRRIYDTQALVQSALADAIVDLPSLRNDGAFFCWVNAIIRHKIAKKNRELLPEIQAGHAIPLDSLPDEDASEDRARDEAEQYVETLEAILELFPRYPEQMAATTLKLLDEKPIAEIQELLQQSRRTVFRWTRQGIRLLREHISAR